MKLIARVKLLPTPDQRALLLQTLERANAACDHLSAVAWETKTFGKFALQQQSYREVRESFGLSAQMVVRAVGKVADGYKLDHQVKRTFHPRGAFPFDSRILSWRLQTETVSIWTLAGRIVIPFATGRHQQALLQSQQGQSDLVYRKGAFYLYAVCEVEEPPTTEVDDFLGVDLGVVNLATDSDGKIATSDEVEAVRTRYQDRRTTLQRVGTRSAKRRLKKLSQREANFRRNENHRISKELVSKAKDTGRGIALEELKGIRDRVTVRKPQRARHASWSFAQLRALVEYKARRAGIPVVAVDPRNTSRTCPTCGCVDADNRPSQAVFRCVSCGFSGHADTVAAINIAARGRHQTAYGSARLAG